MQQCLCCLFPKGLPSDVVCHAVVAVTKRPSNNGFVVGNNGSNLGVAHDYDKEFPRPVLPDLSLCFKPLSEERSDLRSAGGNRDEGKRDHGFGPKMPFILP